MALHISRRDGESVWIGESVVTVYMTEKGKTYLQIDAPPEVIIRRAELAAETFRRPPVRVKERGTDAVVSRRD